MLRVRHPANYLRERCYIYHVLLNEFLGIAYTMEVCTGTDVEISLLGDPTGKTLRIADVLFQTPEHQWLTAAALPQRPLAQWHVDPRLRDAPLVKPELPIIYGQPRADHLWYEEHAAGARLGIDIFGSAFWMLTRYEESVLPERDQHDRFPATAALAFQAGFLDRPIVNEYLELLYTACARLWPNLQRKPRRYRVQLSHDVDWPWGALGRSGYQVIKSSLGDLARRHDPLLALQRIRAYAGEQCGIVYRDPYDTFDLLMDQSERHGWQSAFYFITDHTAGEQDGVYCIDEPRIHDLIQHIAQRGHRIGLHPSYHTYRDAAQTTREFQRLYAAAAAAQVQQTTWGGRQHYLRWANPTTWQNWEEAGLNYDSTLTFADQIGFRCGTCYAYPVFNLRTRQQLTLYERPLIVMDVTLLQYMQLGWDAAVEVTARLNRVCRQFAGEFTLLWHNSTLITRMQRHWYSILCESLDHASTTA